MTLPLLAKLGFTALVLFFLTSPAAFFSIGTKWQRWSLGAHWTALAAALLFFSAQAIRWVWSL